MKFKNFVCLERKLINKVNTLLKHYSILKRDLFIEIQI
jgi:hypothetical protein